MKHLAYIMFSLLLLSCGNAADEEERKDDSAAVTEALEAAGEVSTRNIDSMCYLLVEGTGKQDTKALKLVVNGDDVTGLLMYLPHEKDARFGRISGSKDGDIIFGTWHYEQEGVKDSVEVAFRKEGDALLQQAPSFNQKTGREYLNTSAPYSIRYAPTDCRNLPQHNIDLSK